MRDNVYDLLHVAQRERDEARAEVERLRVDACSNCAKLRAEVERLREWVSGNSVPNELDGGDRREVDAADLIAKIDELLAETKGGGHG